MRKEFWFISDLHLRYVRRNTTKQFLNFLTTRAAGAERLYILGDLFDVWVGDDDPSPPNNAVKKSLRALSDSGTQVFFQHGNRDFLIGQRFADEAKVQLLGDYEVIDLFGTPTLLTHGDLLCTDDIAYLAFRAKNRQRTWRRDVLSKPLLVRLAYARWYRIRSYFHKRKKSQEIMDVNQQTVERVMHDFDVTQLIHGHTHRPAVHELILNGTKAQRIVLDQWQKLGNAIRWDSTGFKIETIR